MKNKQKILYGAGQIGAIKFNELGSDNVYAFVDKNKHGTKNFGKPVLHPSELPELSKKYEIVFCVQNYEDVLNYLISIGIDIKRLNIKNIIYHDDTLLSKIANHSNFINYLSDIGNKEGMKILEVGSRVVTGANLRSRFHKADYIGFDYYEGENVDVVGDAHKLSYYFKENEKFDIIFSSAVFEHFAMPWVVAKEVTKLLKIGGIIFIETHFSCGLHERPWHFFHFTDMGLRVLFSSALGYECIEAGFSNPIEGRFSESADEYLKGKPMLGMYCHSGYLGRKIKEIKDFDWNNVNLYDVIGETKYPIPK